MGLANRYGVDPARGLELLGKPPLGPRALRRLVVAVSDAAAAQEIWAEIQAADKRKDKTPRMSVEQSVYFVELREAHDWYYEEGPGKDVADASDDGATAFVMPEPGEGEDGGEDE